MSSNDDSKSFGSNAKKPGIISQEFTNDTRLGKQISEASPEGKRQLNDHLRISDMAYNDRAKFLEETRGNRETKEFSRLQERYINNPALRPDTPESIKNDIEIMRDDAKSNVAQRDERNLADLKKVSKTMTYAILKEDRQRTQSHTQAHGDHQPEQER